MILRKDGTVLSADSTRLDLSEQEAREADFRAVYIKGGNLSDSDLRGADFSGARLDGTYCYRTNFSECNFTGALLEGVVLDEANLDKTKFIGARLVADSIGGGCSLRGTDLRTAILADAVFIGCKYDPFTLFPVGFEPISKGMVRVA